MPNEPSKRLECKKPRFARSLRGLTSRCCRRAAAARRELRPRAIALLRARYRAKFATAARLWSCNSARPPLAARSAVNATSSLQGARARRRRGERPLTLRADDASCQLVAVYGEFFDNQARLATRGLTSVANLNAYLLLRLDRGPCVVAR